MSDDTTGESTDGAVRFRAENGVAHLIFDRPAARNAMTWRMYDQLAEGLERIEADPAIRVAVLRGAGGKSFVAGTDIAQFTAFTSGDDGIAYEEKIEGYLDELERVRVPTIAVVEGVATGGGLVIANCCDLRVATTGARFGVPIARTLGNCLSTNNLRRLCATLGVGTVKRMLLLAELPTAEALMPLGYLAAVAAPEALDAAVAEICARLLSHAPVTMRVTREMLRQLEINPQPDAAGLIRDAYGSADFAAGVRAFLDKRPADWSGR